MSANLDKSLDEITAATRQARGGRRRSQRRAAGRPTTTAPVGGIQKNKPTRAAANKPAMAKGAAHTGDSKVIVSNLPKDVSEQQIKEYFVQSVGPIKKVELSYGPNSQSRGIANVTFSKPDGASRAFQKLNGLLVDNRPIKIEVILGGAQAANIIPQPKSLAERASQPRAQPKSALDKNAAGGNKAGQATARGRGKRRGTGRSARPSKKTAEELDSEMADYFGGDNAAPANDNANAGAAAAPAPAAADAAMEDEIL